MSFGEKVCLKWQDFSVNLPSVFSELRTVGEFSDVTLACEDGRVEAHRLVLSSASPVFRMILQQTNHPHPLVYMRGVEVATLEAVLDYIYCGEANLLEKDLPDFLKHAEELQLKGLSALSAQDLPQDMESFSKFDEVFEPKGTPGLTFLAHPQGRGRSENPPEIEYQRNTQVEEDQIFLIRNIQEQKLVDENIKENEEDHHTKLSMMKQVDGAWVCKVCGKEKKTKYAIKSHLETHVDGTQFKCKSCKKYFETWDNLRSHLKDSEHILQNFGDFLGKQENTKTEPFYETPKYPASVDPGTLMEKVEGVWTCKVCGKDTKLNKDHMKGHVETHIEGLQYTCSICNKIYTTKDNLRGHFYRAHKASKKTKALFQ